MYNRFSQLFYTFFQNFYFFKLNFYKKFKNLFFNLNHKFFNFFFYNSLFIWKNIFEINFWTVKNQKQPKSSFIFLKNNNISFFVSKKSYNFSFLTNTIKNNFIIFFLFNNIQNVFSLFFLNYFKTNINFNKLSIYFLNIYKKTIGEGFIYLRGLFIIFFIDAAITDDEPLWEPIEWSLVQTWLLFIFIFAWIAENLITSRYGSYTGRDKRVWFAWYKSFWLVELCYAISYGLASLFVIIPFYFELTYTLSFIFSCWNWYTRVFFFFFFIIFISLRNNYRYLLY